MRTRWLLLPCALSITPLFSGAAAQAGSDHALHEVEARSLKWTDVELAGFAPGMKLAVVAGDPGVEGQPYTLRLSFPDGYAFPPHWHPVTENLTVLSGAFHLAMGNSAEAGGARQYVPGDYLLVPAQMSHYGYVRGETVVQLHGVGPFAINLTETTPPPQ